VTGFRKLDVESAVAWLVAEQKEYEWVDQGGETEEARGSNLKILHRIGQRDGTAYNAPRSTNHYVN
jgi:hypothetical protein